ncbi:hypothetical protein [Sinobacterium norvegicum]|uniref:hypothetical protein n=1 Tax=Sinobacterium norvegicum TaxID=1641715 RepID=UPI001F37219C|nr:hypothetical protein [Sinobacterium norvegicum]
MNIFLVLVAVVAAAYLAFSPRLVNSSDWQATVTPLASIMGSGFLVSAPLLAGAVGNYAVLCMAALLLLAFCVGSVIRFNIAHFEPISERGHGTPQAIGFLSRIALSGAYLISVSYYLQLLAAFLLSTFNIENGLYANVITSAILLSIGAIGMISGLDLLEKVERYAVSINLGVICALIVALMLYNVKLFQADTWQLPDLWQPIDGHDIRILLGLLIVVQGFETSRYLGDKHPPAQRIRTMRRAQLISSVIYLSFLSLATILFSADVDADVTGIITMMAPVALVLPIVLSIAAIGSQFSAAVADNAGAGGLLEELSHRRFSLRFAYGFILAATLFLTWATDVNQIIAYASRAFAFYYFLQALVAFTVCYQHRELPNRVVRLVFFSIVATFCFAVFSLGLPAE